METLHLVATVFQESFQMTTSLFSVFVYLADNESERLVPPFAGFLQFGYVRLEVIELAAMLV